MARRPASDIDEVPSEKARQRLPEILERAHRGQPTIITRRGKRYAAVVPLEALPPRPSAVSILDLRGSGKGLWGDVTETIDQLRREWR